MTDNAAKLAALIAAPGGNATGDRGMVTALREDGTVNVRVSSGATYLGVPCLSSYTGRQVGDWVQLTQAGGVWVVHNTYGPDPETSAPTLQNQQQYLYRIADNVVSDTTPTTFLIGQPVGPGAPSALALGYYNGTKNVMQAAVGAAVKSVTLTISRSSDKSDGVAPIRIQVFPHNSNALPTPSITPVTTFTPVFANLEVGQRKDIQLPADWVAGIQANTIKGFMVFPGNTPDGGLPDTTTCILSDLTGGIGVQQSGGSTVRTYDSQSTTDQSITTSEADIAGTSISVVINSSNATVIANATFDFQCNGLIAGKFSWNGTVQSPQAVFGGVAAANRAAVAQTWQITGITAGTYIAKLRAVASSTAGTSAHPHTGLTIMVIGG